MKKYQYTARQVAQMRHDNAAARRRNRRERLTNAARGVRAAGNVVLVCTIFALLCFWLGVDPLSPWCLAGFLGAAIGQTFWDTGVIVWLWDLKDCLWLVLRYGLPVPYPEVEGDMPEVQVVPPGPDERWAREYDETGGLGYAHWDARSGPRR